MIDTRNLGKNGPQTGRIGYGAMVLEGLYGATSEDQAVDTLCHAIDRGMMIDTADAYGNGHNEQLLAKAIKRSAKAPMIATKCGLVFEEGIAARSRATGWGFDLNINCSPEYVASAIDASLQRLEVNSVDLWYTHFPDPGTPIEDTVAAMAAQVQAGKVKYLGLSNVTAEQVRRAHAIHPIVAVQYEYSLWRREAEEELLPTLRELGIALVAWSPLGAGFLTGALKTLNDEDFRQNNPRFRGDNMQENVQRFAELTALAESLSVTPAQLALAWLLHQGDDIFPIPGTRTIGRIDENLDATKVALTDDVMAHINQIAAPGTTAGATLI